MNTPDPLLEPFRAYCDQYLGVARMLGEAVSRAAGGSDPAQPGRAFLEALGGLQRQLAELWAGATAGALPATPFAAPGGAAPYAPFNPFAPGGPFAAPFLATAPLGGALGAGVSSPWAAWAPGLSGLGLAPAVAPALGPTRELQELWQRMTQLGEQAQQAQLRLLEHWNGVVTTSLQQLGERASALLAAAPTPESLRALYDQWVEIAELTYAKAAHGRDFAAAQAEFGNAQSRLRSVQREYLELAAREFDLPTRSELNTVLQQLRDLKRAVHGIEERLAGPGPQAP
ncbi:MAG: hypothetical protein IT480_14085 [Gammaproteobacteria bacterium]|nr:hypothetical protein [Gammaproteobacteria bacterium]